MSGPWQLAIAIDDELTLDPTIQVCDGRLIVAQSIACASVERRAGQLLELNLRLRGARVGIHGESTLVILAERELEGVEPDHIVDMVRAVLDGVAEVVSTLAPA